MCFEPFMCLDLVPERGSESVQLSVRKLFLRAQKQKQKQKTKQKQIRKVLPRVTCKSGKHMNERMNENLYMAHKHFCTNICVFTVPDTHSAYM